MKKSWLSLLIVSTMLLTACEDKAQTAKLQQAETTIAQLKTELAQSQTQLAEQSKVNKELRSALQVFPRLRTKTVELFNQSQTLKLAKPSSDNLGDDEGSVIKDVTLVETGIDWLDKLLLEEMAVSLVGNEQSLVPKNVSKSQLQEMLKQQFSTALDAVKKGEISVDHSSLTMNYVGQWKNMATFSLSFFSYTGGAHGMYSTEYINIDVDKQKKITLNDLITEKNQQKAEELLWEIYKNNRENLFVERKDFNLSHHFFFTPEGIGFSYPPYEIGSYAEGEIILTLPWWRLSQIIHRDYLLKEIKTFNE